MRALICAAIATAVLAVGAGPAHALPPVKHVFVVFLENNDYVETFGTNTDAKYFTGTLAPAGQLLTQYYGIGHLSLDNYIATVSGQPPNPVTQADCTIFQDFAGTTTTPNGVAVGQGCVFPTGVQTIADQLEAKGLSWKGYMEDMGAPCRHPEINSQDNTQQAKVGDQYATRHNPFMYFHSVIDEPSCAQNDVPLDRLPADLADPAATPNYAFITPNLCNDGHDEPKCVDGRDGGLKAADAWLREWVPKITSSKAFQDDGMLLITFDEAEASGSMADASACCNEQPGPNTANPGGPTPGPGGGRIGGVVLSPFVQPGSVNPTPYNQYAFLRSTEDLFGLEHLGFAAQDGLKPFGDDVFGRPGGGPVPATPPSVMTPTSTPGVSTSRAPASAPYCATGPKPQSRTRRFKRGTLIQMARIARSGQRARLVLRHRRSARLYVRVRTKRARRYRRIGVPAVRGCGTISITLPRGHGRFRVSASLVEGTERRAGRY